MAQLAPGIHFKYLQHAIGVFSDDGFAGQGMTSAADAVVSAMNRRHNPTARGATLP